MLKELFKKLGLQYIPVEPHEEEKFIKLFTEKLEYKPTTSNEYVYLATYYRFVLGQKDNSIPYYQQAADMGCTRSLLNLGYIYKKEYKFEKAKKYWEKAVELKCIAGYYYLARLYKHVDHKTSCDYYVLGARGGDVRCMLYLGWLFEHDKDYESAESYYRQAYLKNKSGIKELIELYLKQNDPETAFLFAWENRDQLECGYIDDIVNRLKYPVVNKDEIYPILETFEFKDISEYKGSVLRIMQDVISRKVQVLTRLAYQYKKYNEKEKIL